MPWRWCWRGSRGDLHPGDVIVLNDPYAGGMHLPDIFMIKPIFAGERAPRLRRGHRAPLRHGRAGARLERLGFDRDLPGRPAHPADEALRRAARPTGRCSPSSRRTSACPTSSSATSTRSTPPAPSASASSSRSTRATATELEAYFDRLLDYGEALTRKAIAAWPDGDYAFTDYIDGDGFSPDPIPIACRITVAGDQLAVDFAGSLAAGEGRDQLDLQLREVGDLSRHPLRARPRGPEQRRRLPLHQRQRAGGLDPQPAHAGAGGGAGADRLPRRRHGDGRARPGRAGAADGGGRRAATRSSPSAATRADGPSSWST